MHKVSLALIFLCALFVAAKLPHLSLPFFWDEAWPYSTGVFYMYSHGLSLLPGAIPFDISRGHPLFFHFISTLWMKIFGTSLVAVHSFPLLVSILFIVCIYFFCADFFSETVALVSCLLIMLQPVFFSQAAMLLPEILVALLTLLSLWTCLREKRWLYILFASLLLLTKESGVVIVISLLCWRTFEKINQETEKNLLQIAKENIYLLAPVAIASVFFILQKMQTGHFFLPMYVNEENFKWTLFSEKLKNYFAYVFIYQGRNVLSVFLILAFVMIALRKLKISPGDKRIIFPLAIFIILYLLFSSFSFYSPRYMLSVIPFVIIISTYMVFKATDKKLVFYIGFILVTTVVSISYCLRKKPINDHSPSYADGIAVTQNAVTYCEQEKMYDKKICSNFLMRMYLTHPEHGYLSAGKKFSVTDKFESTVNVCIFTSYESDDALHDFLKQQSSYNLVKRFEKNYAWSEVYARK
jgi:4-amino-4-deoxy-L-arabinose transferase-like glycosyltransferase